MTGYAWYRTHLGSGENPHIKALRDELLAANAELRSRVSALERLVGDGPQITKSSHRLNYRPPDIAPDCTSVSSKLTIRVLCTDF